MTIYPAIDIKGGRCVRLLQGRAAEETVYAENPAEVAAEFRVAGSEWVHVVDLDGAFAGEPQNLSEVRAIAQLGMKVQLGGGLRTRAAVERALGFGVWPLFADARFDGPRVAPYLRYEDVERIDAESLWNALS